MKGIKVNYNTRSWEEIEIPDGAVIYTEPKIVQCAGCGKRMTGGIASVFLRNMNFISFKVCDECNARLWQEDSDQFEYDDEDEEEYEEFNGEWGSRKEEFAAVRKEALEREQRGEHVGPFEGGVFAIHDILTKEEFNEMTNKIEESFLEECDDEISDETQELLYSKNFFNVIQETFRGNMSDDQKQIQCMYCHMPTSNKNHVCDECEASGREIAEKLEVNAEQVRRLGVVVGESTSAKPKKLSELAKKLYEKWASNFSALSRGERMSKEEWAEMMKEIEEFEEEGETNNEKQDE